jgi:hypothetical protein
MLFIQGDFDVTTRTPQNIFLEICVWVYFAWFFYKVFLEDIINPKK